MPFSKIMNPEIRLCNNNNDYYNIILAVTMEISESRVESRI